MEKIELRSMRDDVKLTLVMPEWYEQSDENERTGIQSALKGYVNLFSQMISNKVNFYAMNAILCKALVDLIMGIEKE